MTMMGALSSGRSSA